MCKSMSDAETRARQFLSEYVEVVRVEPASVRHGIYNNTPLDKCEIFIFKFPSEHGVGSGKYLAVPKDGREPFYIGEIGE